MNYKVLATGSKGNAVRINDVMIDCGIPFNRMKNDLYECRYLLITHTHSDHINKSTLKAIKKQFPRIEIIGNFEVAQSVGVSRICNPGYMVETNEYNFMPFQCVHDVECTGFVWQHKGNEIIYATDTNSLEFAPDCKYDYMFLESNYDKYKIEAIKNPRKTYGYDVTDGAHRHLSTQRCKEFYYTHRKSKESPLIELHMSSRFY